MLQASTSGRGMNCCMIIPSRSALQHIACCSWFRGWTQEIGNLAVLSTLYKMSEPKEDWVAPGLCFDASYTLWINLCLMFSLPCLHQNVLYTHARTEVEYGEVMNPKENTTYLFTDNGCGSAIQQLTWVKIIPQLEDLWACRHETAQRLREERRGNRASTTQGSMSWYMPERQRDPNPAQSSSGASLPRFKLFCLPLLGKVRSKLGFLWEGSREVHFILRA